MRNLVIFGTESMQPSSPAALMQSVDIDGVPYRCGIVYTPDVDFDPSSDENVKRVLIRVRAFSLNYRDKGICSRMKGRSAAKFSAIGSEFAAEVVEVGAAVTRLAPGDRVISNHHYTGDPMQDGYMEGVVTNQSSKEYMITHQEKLTKIPDGMGMDVGAAFSIGAQTGYSMVRRLDIEPGSNVLVTAAKSNTSLFVLHALKQSGADVYASTTSTQFTSRFEAMGVKEVLPLERGGDHFQDSEAVTAFAERVGGFDYVFDPFYDVHLKKVLMLMNPFGTYVTCGMASQTPDSGRESGLSGFPRIQDVMFLASVKNISIVGNCIGLREDLERSLADYASGTYSVEVDSVFERDAEAAAFLDRTFNDRSRFGKVVFQYN